MPVPGSLFGSTTLSCGIAAAAIIRLLYYVVLSGNWRATIRQSRLRCWWDYHRKKATTITATRTLPNQSNYSSAVVVVVGVRSTVLDGQ